MAQPTVTSRPATWAGTSGPILYKLTSTNYANAGYRLEVEIWDSTAAAKIADAVYYANSAGLLMCDISSFLKANMSLNNDSDLTSGTVYTDTNWIKYYIKYQEIWTASSETQVNDSANSRYAIYGGVQFGSINSMTDYYDPTFDFLILSNSPYFVKDYPFTFSHIGHIGSYLRVQRFLNGSSVNVTDTLISTAGVVRGKHTETSTADKLELSIVAKAITLGALSTFTNQGTGTSWTTGSNPSFSISGAFAITKKLVAAFAGISGVTYTFPYNIDTVDSSGVIDVIISLLDASYASVGDYSIGAFGTGNYTGTASITPSAAASYISVVAFLNDDSGLLSGSGDINSLTHSGVDVIMSEVKTVTLAEDCSTIMLQWKNSLGGDECFPFQHNKEYTWHYSNRKAKRLTLYADNLTLNQWETIQGLNTIGELYKTPITEMTTSLNRTSATIGQSVYVLNSDGTKIGVNVIGLPNTTNTKRKKHSATIVIEYPELLLQ